MPHKSQLTDALVDRVHAAGLKLATWVVDEPAELAQLARFGLYGVGSNRPGVLLEAIADGLLDGHSRLVPEGRGAAPCPVPRNRATPRDPGTPAPLSRGRAVTLGVRHGWNSGYEDVETRRMPAAAKRA